MVEGNKLCQDNQANFEVETFFFEIILYQFRNLT